MGLDAVELAMEVEDRFKVKLPDAECARVRTVADLAALVITLLPRSEEGCPTARAFYAFRKLAIEGAGFERESIRPTTRLEVLFPRSERRVWRKLCAVDDRLPELETSPRVDRIGLCVTALVVLGIFFSVAALWGRLGAGWAVLIGLCSIMLFAALLRCAWRLLATHFPRRVETVGDLCGLLGLYEIPANSQGPRLIAQQGVLDEVRRITAAQVGMPIEQVKPESSLQRDLGIG